MANILGISAFYHDSAAALVCNGQLVAAAQNERFTRRKHDPNFPIAAIDFCIRRAGLRLAELDYIVFYDKPLLKFDRLMETYVAFAPRGFSSFRLAMPVWLGSKLNLRRVIRRHLPEATNARILFLEHHQSHAASAFFPSPFEDAAILTIDGVGEWTTAAIGVGEGNKLRILAELQFPHSLGLLYSAFTYYCGFKVNSGEYKLMGLAPYGKPVYAETIKKYLVKIRPDGSFWLNMDYFDYCHGLTMTNARFHRLFGGPPRTPEGPLDQRHADLAASIQLVTEEVVLLMAAQAHKLTGKRALAMAGGVALNCVANGRLLREGPFDRIWVQPAAGDAGGALGAALFTWFQLLDRPRTPDPNDSQQGSFLGPDFTRAEIEAAIASVGLDAQDFPDEQLLLDAAVELLASGKVVGWFQGRMEFGPRALGARSILADARQPHMQSLLNLKIKHREGFRPFAPAVLQEHVAEYFDVPADFHSPYMLFVAPVHPRQRLTLSEHDRKIMNSDPDFRRRLQVVRSTIPAVTHLDYSARIQTVDRARHGRFYRLLKTFYARTGCPVLLNTSFNIRGEPIVCTPAEAIRCFLVTGLDALVLGDFLLTKDRVRHRLEPEEIEAYLAAHEPD